jgi:hypothetical protein
MNCANHPDTPVAAYCQFCGKPLCAQCVHKVNNIVSCEPCLAARIGAASGGTYGVNINDGKGFQYTATGPLPPGSVPPTWGTEPWLAFVLGWIPGVGAMYNGQFAKALAHVVIFALLVDFSHYSDVLGVVVFGWVVYQVFDAYQTAIARRDGLPLPNPLGLNDIAQWFGVRPTPPANQWVGGNPNATGENPAGTAPAVHPVGTAGPVSGFAPAAEYGPPYVPPTPPTPPNPAEPSYPSSPLCSPGPLGPNRRIHAGAVILIVLGLALLLGNLGILSEYWIHRGWPILLIGIGVWMAICRSQKPPVGGAR